MDDIKKRGKNLSDQQKKDIEDYFRDYIFWPLHTEVINILKTQMYLVHDEDEHKPFYDYLRHVTQQRIQHELYTFKGVQTDYLKGMDWPQKLWGEVESGLRRALKEQKELLDIRYAKTLKRKNFKPGLMI